MENREPGREKNPQILPTLGRPVPPVPLPPSPTRAQRVPHHWARRGFLRLLWLGSLKDA